MLIRVGRQDLGAASAGQAGPSKMSQTALDIEALGSWAECPGSSHCNGVVGQLTRRHWNVGALIWSHTSPLTPQQLTPVMILFVIF